MSSHLDMIMKKRPVVTNISSTTHKNSSNSISASRFSSSVGANTSSSSLIQKDWRGKYLRALKIYAPTAEVDVRKEKELNLVVDTPYGTRARLDSDLSSYCSSKDEEELFAPFQSPENRVRFQNVHSALVNNPYGFTLKRGISRSRRCHTDPFLEDENVSAPIQIPVASTTTTTSSISDSKKKRKSPRASKLSELTNIGMKNVQAGTTISSSNSNSNSKRRMRNFSIDNHSSNNVNRTVHLLSWEEPVAMIAAGNAVTNGHAWSVDDAEVKYGNDRGSEEEEEDLRTLGEEEDIDMDLGETEEDSGEGEIFEMEGLEEAEEDSDSLMSKQHSSSNNSSNSNSNSNSSSSRNRRGSCTGTGSGRRRTKEGMKDLPKSFVPPHQMIERDCFSLGLQNEFKRRPVRI